MKCRTQLGESGKGHFRNSSWCWSLHFSPVQFHTVSTRSVRPTRSPPHYSDVPKAGYDAVPMLICLTLVVPRAFQDRSSISAPSPPLSLLVCSFFRLLSSRQSMVWMSLALWRQIMPRGPQHIDHPRQRRHCRHRTGPSHSVGAKASCWLRLP